MKLNRYQNVFLTNMNKQLAKWLEESSGHIPAEEVYRFLHSIKGTAGTLKLDELSVLASSLMEESEGREASYSKEELSQFLMDLPEKGNPQEQLVEPARREEAERDEGVPLIQVIEDDISMLIVLKDALEEKGWMVIANTDGSQAVSRFTQLNPDCMVINIDLPEKSGYEILEEIKQQDMRTAVPKVMISSNNTKDSRIKAFQLGADDFIGKPLDLEEFIVRVERQLERKRILDRFVLIDELTQVYNRRHLHNALSSSLSDLKRTRSSLTAAMIDLDHFKKVNDTYGHLVGDKVLKEFASFMKRNLRGSDTICRYGGEEFFILFPHTSEAETMQKLESLLEEFAAIPFSSGEEAFTVTFSAGVYMVRETDTDLETIIKKADDALYHAKKNGRARIEAALPAVQGKPNKKLLVSIIDDDAIIRTMLAKMMETSAFPGFSLDIETYEDGMVFMQSGRIKEEGRHFMVLDGMMPVMDGLEVLQKVKRSSVNGELTVLMLTGRKSERDIAKALKLGADDYMTKPFSITELQARIAMLIKRT
ncbi:diguanylate cyclase [Peribacillus sp. SCS-37]|uniref:GGDEF domain-containing response regulator n=1 Tax=Paraperibacillus esterisolvens TaxID=3115296 RepID=UPI0039064E5F